MKVDIRMSDEKMFSVSSWWAQSPEFVLEALAQQLEAAASIWPELRANRITIVRRSGNASARGRSGGAARAAALSPERRSEIASAAAKARWSENSAPALRTPHNSGEQPPKGDPAGAGAETTSAVSSDDGARG